MAGIMVAEECKVVHALPAVDIGGSAKASDIFALKNYTHATILVSVGAIGNDATMTVEASEDASGTGADAIAFNYHKVTAANGDTLGARTAATASGVTIAAASDDNKHLVIEIDARDLPADHPWLCVKFTNAAAALICVFAVLSGARYQGLGSPSAIA